MSEGFEFGASVEGMFLSLADDTIAERTSIVSGPCPEASFSAWDTRFQIPVPVGQ